MNDILAIFARSLVIGVFVAAPVGAIGCLVIQRTLVSGWRAGMATGFGVATADGIYASVAAFGLTAVSSALVGASFWLRIVGGAVLIALGLKAAFSAPATCAAEDSRSSHTGSYTSAVALTLANPMTIMAFAAVFATAGLASVGAAGWTAALAATLGVALGSLAWWFALVSVTWKARSLATERTIGSVGRLSGAVVAAFGAFALVSAFVAT